MADTTDSGSAEATDDRAAFLAEMANGKGKAEVVPAPAKTKDPEPELEAAPDGDAEDTEDAEIEAAPEETESEPDEDAEESEPDEDEDATDPDTVRRLQTVQKAERRAKEKLERDTEAAHAQLTERAAKFEAEWKPRVEEVEHVKGLISRRRWVDALVKLGATKKDFETIGRVVFAHSDHASVTPEQRASAEQLMQSQESLSAAEAARAEVAALREEMRKRDEAAAGREAATRYLAQLEAAIGAKSPLAARAFKKNPGALRAKLGAIAGEMIGKDDTYAAPAKVLAEYEKRRRAELEDDGVDVTALLGAAAVKKTDPQKTAGKIEVVDKTKKAKPTTDDSDKIPTREEMLAEIAALPGRDD